MSANAPFAAPAWQTEELQDEWVELDEEHSDKDEDNLTYGTRSISLTAPLATHIHTNSDLEAETPSLGRVTAAAVGTFLIREDIPSGPLLPKTPGGKKKGIIKDFFSPLPLERMFEPPSPQKDAVEPVPPSALPRPAQGSSNRGNPPVEEDEIIETDMPNMNSFHGRKPSIACQFTFSVPRDRPLNPNLASDGAFPQAHSTPIPPFASNGTAPPTTDPRLRLFQFQYDTYTRDHLSAMVDSIAINSGSGTTPSPTSLNHGLSRVSEMTGSVENMSHLRSAKRVKLSPRSDFYGEGAGAGASIARPRILGRDYVGESRSLMQQIKQARDFSTISTVASTHHTSPSSKENDNAPTNEPDSQGLSPPSLLAVPKGTNSSNGGSYSSSSYREQAAALMAQIKNDMKGQKRLFSGDTETSCVTSHVDDKFNSFSSNLPDPIALHVPPLSPESKENRRDLSHRRTSSLKSTKSNASKHKPSPMKSRRNRDSASLLEEVSRLSIQDRRSFSEGSHHSSHPSETRRAQVTRTASLSTAPHHNAPSSLAPPAYPSSSLRNEDLNRFVSSSTASGTTLTAGSAPSFVKHAGPPHIRTIAPADLPQLPDRLGDMLFDKVMMKWVKSTAQATQNAGEPIPPEELSEDPFGDIESLRDDSRGRESEYEVSETHPHPAEMSRIEEQSEVDDQEEMELNSFSTDDPSALIVDVMTGVETYDDDATTDSDDGTEQVTITDLIGYDSDDLNQSVSMTSPPVDAQISAPLPPTAPALDTVATPHRAPPLQTTNTPVIRSALKSHSATPVSAMKDPSRSKFQTPLNKGHRRSVSFSDGRREGPIQGLGESTTTDGDDHENGTEFMASERENAAGPSGIVESVRSKRIAQMMNALEHDDTDTSPSKTGTSGQPEMQAVSSRTLHVASPADSSRRTLSRSRTHRLSFMGDNKNANATFLTECSFTVSHDRLVEVITDVEPFTPHWDELSCIDLSNKRLESVARLKEFLPRLDALSLHSNQLSWLSGVPGSVRTLSVASNSLTGLTSYNHLLNLENLDISRNDIESLNQLSCLRHLRELKADGNKITSIEGLQRMDGLVKLSLQGNSIRSVDFVQYRWTRLEMLNLSQNRLDSVLGLASLQALVALNLDDNELVDLELDGTMPKLRILRVSGNRLHQLRVASMPNLRTLYADNNSLTSLVKVNRLTKLENLSLRNQRGRGLRLLTRDVRDVKRLYLSGNPLQTGFLDEPCYNLLYLEIAACRLTALPEDLAQLVPNLRVLNLNYNFLEDPRPLEGLTRLRKLTMIGSRLQGTKPMIRLLQRMPDVEMLDLRMNPCTLGWYLPLLVKDIPGALQPSEGNAIGAKGDRAAVSGWQELDSKFRRDLPDESYLGRLAYRGLIMRACARIRMLDGVEVTEKERAKADHLLAGILSKGKKWKGKGT
ncbi:putative leucine-rich repeats, outliers [Lyophyllum shimeji]|uniref:Leucine-rich repeats, outliers n=1 Tax=Lyophyllum shimeji TaxID=47721 RepID=A0A9P3PL30_LYOSH|nr:putative leucine-rich repeats, outliers [Lyophyllum shimeji]